MQRIRNFLFLFLIIGVFKLLGLVFGLFGLLGGKNKKQHLDTTLRLYRRVPGGIAFAWFYEIDGMLFVDRGTLGEMAGRRNVPVSDWPEIEAEIAAARAEGFAEIDDDDLQIFQIVYAVDDTFGSSDELAKRNAVLDLLDEHFALTGQGYWIDSASGMGTMENTFLVVDFEVARASVKDLLDGTEFGDYIALRNTEELAEVDQIRAEASA